MEHAQAFEATDQGKIFIEVINGALLYGDKATPAEYSAGLKLAIERGWIELHESGTGRRGGRLAPAYFQEAPLLAPAVQPPSNFLIMLRSSESPPYFYGRPGLMRRIDTPEQQLAALPWFGLLLTCCMRPAGGRCRCSGRRRRATSTGRCWPRWTTWCRRGTSTATWRRRSTSPSCASWSATATPGSGDRASTRWSSSSSSSILFFEGLRSERKLVETASLNLAHRWYLGYALDEPLPDHSTLSKVRQRLGVGVFRRFFEHVVELCQRRRPGVGAGALLRRHAGAGQRRRRLRRAPARAGRRRPPRGALPRGRRRE